MLEKTERTSGGEHVFAYGIGGAFTIDRVCLDCDNRLGNVADAPLQEQYVLEQNRFPVGGTPLTEAKLKSLTFVSPPN